MGGGHGRNDVSRPSLSTVSSNWLAGIAPSSTRLRVAERHFRRIIRILYATTLGHTVAVTQTPDFLQDVPTTSNHGSATHERAKFRQDMSEAVEDALSGSNGKYAVVIKDLNRTLTYSRNEYHAFATASLYKLWVMIETYQQIADGRFTEETRINRTVEELNKAVGIASETAFLKKETLNMSVKEALEKMITISHNYSAYLLIHKIGSENLRLFVERNEFTRSNTGPAPKSTASDVAALLEKLYKGELGTPEHTQKMLDLLAAQTRNEIIPRYLPKDVKVMHKTGELGRVKHDVGIVSAPKGDYVIVLMSDTSDRKHAAERLANVSRNVHELMN